MEDDPSTGRYYVGRGCYPNREGVVQLDAALMRGNDHAFGAVSALEGLVLYLYYMYTHLRENMSTLNSCANVCPKFAGMQNHYLWLGKSWRNHHSICWLGMEPDSLPLVQALCRRIMIPL